MFSLPQSVAVDLERFTLRDPRSEEDISWQNKLARQAERLRKQARARARRAARRRDRSEGGAASQGSRPQTTETPDPTVVETPFPAGEESRLLDESIALYTNRSNTSKAVSKALRGNMTERPTNKGKTLGMAGE